MLNFVGSKLIIPEPGGDTTLWWKLASIISCGTLAEAIIPALVKVFTSVGSRHTREFATSSEEGGASLNILSALVAGSFSPYSFVIRIVSLLSLPYYFCTLSLGATPP